MQRTLYKALSLLLCLSFPLIASRMPDMSYFEDPARDSKYSNTCIVRMYNSERVEKQTNGTLCQCNGHAFILTSTDPVLGDKHTVIFQDGTEWPIEKLVRITKTDKMGYKRSLLALGVIKNWPDYIVPAEIEEDKFFSHNADSPCYIAGYGSRLNPYSRERHILYDAEPVSMDLALRPSLVSLNFNPGYRTIYNSDEKPDLRGHFCTFGSQQATPYERPIPPGFLGASLRTPDNKVCGIVIGSIPYWQTEKFLTQRPFAARTLYTLHDWINNIKNTWQLSASTFGIGSALSYQAYSYSPVFGMLSMLTTTAFSYLGYHIKDLNDMLTYYTFTPGSEHYGVQIHPWVLEIKRFFLNDEKR